MKIKTYKKFVICENKYWYRGSTNNRYWILRPDHNERPTVAVCGRPDTIAQAKNHINALIRNNV